MRRVDGTSTVGTLFVVSLGMSLKEEQTLQRPFKPPRLQIVHVPLALRRLYVTRADLRKCGATSGCAACSDVAVHGKTATPHTEECRKRIGEQMEHHLEGHERLQVHKRRRDAEPEVMGTGGILWSWWSIRQDLRGNEELSDVAAFSSGPSPHEDCLAQDSSVDDVRGGVLESEEPSKRDERKSSGVGVWEPVIRKEMDAGGARAVSLRWIDTDKGDASIGREREIQKATKKSDVPSAAELFSGNATYI